MFCKHFTTFLQEKDEKQAYFITSTDTCLHIYNKQCFICKFSVFYISLSNDVQSLLLFAWKSAEFYNL